MKWFFEYLLLLQLSVFCSLLTARSSVFSPLSSDWHARRDSNPQPAVLETAALPIELLAYIFSKQLTADSQLICEQ